MKVLELFGGYGSQALALENLGIDFESDLCDNDRYAIQAYNQLHGETFNYGDICTIDETKLPYYDLITYSSPCQDFSVAGKQAGGEKDSGTRSSLLWECERIIRAVKPKYLLMENVKALTSKKFMPLFQNWLKVLEGIGYQNYWKVLNAKDYGVPQNRERVFVVSILGGGAFTFPEAKPLTKRLKDILENDVDEKYYINKVLETRTKEPICCASRGRNPDNPSDRSAGQHLEQRFEINEKGTTNTITTVSKDNYIVEPINTEIDGTSRTIKAQYAKNSYANFLRKGTFGATGVIKKDLEPQILREPINLYPNSGNPQAGRVYNVEGISPAMDTCQGGNRMPKVMVEGYFKYPNSDKKHQSNTVISKEGISTTLDTATGGNRMPKITEYRFFNQAIRTAEEKGVKNGDTIDAFNQRVNGSGVCPTLTTRPEGFKTAILPVQNCRIRKLTPRECWRLMGVKDEQFDKLHGISNSQLYKLAGNSIVVDVLMGIFKNMFLEPTVKLKVPNSRTKTN